MSPTEEKKLENELQTICEFQLNTRNVWRGPKLLIVYKQCVVQEEEAMDVQVEGCTQLGYLMLTPAVTVVHAVLSFTGFGTIF